MSSSEHLQAIGTALRDLLRGGARSGGNSPPPASEIAVRGLSESALAATTLASESLARGTDPGPEPRPIDPIRGSAACFFLQGDPVSNTLVKPYRVEHA